jgi:WD40 repeat protein
VTFAGGTRDSLIRHWGLAPTTALPALRGHIGGVAACAWRADGKLLASAGTDDGTLRLWSPDANPPSSHALVMFPARQGTVHDLALSPEGRHVITANADGTISVLRLAKLGEVFQAP